MHRKIVWQVQIAYLHRKILCELEIAYLEIFRRFKWLLRKAQFFGYCESIIFLLRISLLFIYCKSSNYFNTANRLNIWLLCKEKFYDNFKSPISKYFDNLYGKLRKAQFCGHCAYIILLLRISQLFMYCRSINYFTTGNRLHNCLLCIEKLYDNFKSPISKHNNDLYGYCANYNFLATAHLSFPYCASRNYLSTASRPIISTLEIV